MLAEKIEYYEKTGKVLKVTPAKYKAEFPWLKEVDSLALCNAQLHLQTACKNFFRDPSVGFPKFMLPCVEVVPAGVVEIVRLQREDFAYIKP